MRISFTASLAALLFLGTTLFSQESEPTIRHHRVAESAPEDPTSADVEQAETAMQKSDFASAEPLLKKAVAAKPDDYRAWFDLGYVYNATNRTTDAIDAYRKAVTAKPDVFESNLNLGLLLAGQGNHAEAEKFLKASTSLKPTADANRALARAWMALGKVQITTDQQQALTSFLRAGELNPKDPQPHLAAAGLLVAVHQPDKAATEYQTAFGLDPASENAIADLVNTAIAQKNYADADAVLRKLTAADTKNGQLHVQLARLLNAEGKNDEASQQLQAGAQTDPNDPRAAMELGSVYVKAGKNAEAEQEFRTAVQGMPQNADAYAALGSVLMYEKKYPEAQQAIMHAIRLNPHLGEAYGNLAIVAAANKNYVLTLQALDERAKYLPEIPVTDFLRATTYDNLKDIPKAVEYYQRFLAEDGGKFPDQEWQARHRLIAIDPKHADKYRVKVKN